MRGRTGTGSSPRWSSSRCSSSPERTYTWPRRERPVLREARLGGRPVEIPHERRGDRVGVLRSGRHRPIAGRGIQIRVDRTRLDVVDSDTPSHSRELRPILSSSLVTTKRISLRFSSYYFRDWTSWSLVFEEGSLDAPRPPRPRGVAHPRIATAAMR